MTPKVMQILEEDPEIYDAADTFVEAADWVVWQLTGRLTRNASMAGYKNLWSKREGYPLSLIHISSMTPWSAWPRTS